MARIRMKLVSDKFVGYGILVHLIAIFFCGFTLIYQQTLKKESGSNQSFHPGFFCDDPKIKLPYVEEQVSTLACAVIWIVAAVVVVLVVEPLTVYLISMEKVNKWGEILARKNSNASCLRKAWPHIIEISRILSFFLIGVLFCVLTSETTKITVTSLRPYFLAVCKPNITAKDCLNEFGTQKFVENYVCKEKDDHILKEAVKSFFSGHAAFSFYGATFIILYLQSRLPALTVFRKSENIKKKKHKDKATILVNVLTILRPYLQYGFLFLALFISLTRIQDKRHHATDVVVGIIIGFADGILIMIFVADIFNTPRAFQEKCASEVEYDYESVADQLSANNIMDLDQVDHGSTPTIHKNQHSTSMTLVQDANTGEQEIKSA